MTIVSKPTTGITSLFAIILSTTITLSATTALLFPSVTYAKAPAKTLAKFIPTTKEYSPFLLNTWQDDKPSVLVFADPYCPYCIKAIPKIETLKDYNVYIFWSPILGQRSIKRVDEIFQCEQVVASNVLIAVQNRQSPQCKGAINTVNLQLNKKVVDGYNISAVPSYFLQGKRVSLPYLLANSQYRPLINGVAINWQRFNLMKAYNRPTTKSMALVIPAKFSNDVEKLVAENKPEFLFLENNLINKYPQLLHCEQENNTCIKEKSLRYKNKLAEFKLMLSGSLPKDKIILIDSNGLVATI